MIIRKLRVNLRYAAGEIAIIVVGILLAITLDSCNDNRNARRLERQYLRQLVDDLRTDTTTFGLVDSVLTRKRTSLAFADSIITRHVALRDTLRFLQAVVSGANFAWNQPRVRTTTFDELQTTGNLRLLREPELRAQIIRYYTSAESGYMGIAGRRTRYGPLSYELLPRTAEFVLDSAAARLQATRLVATILHSDLATAIVAERNFAIFVAERNVQLRQRALELLRDLERRSD